MTKMRNQAANDFSSKAREWLRRNKVFFDTVASTALTIAAITVAIVQANIADRQTRIAGKQTELLDKQNTLVELQTRIAESQALPVFEIRIAQQLNTETQRADDNFLTIDNTGGLVREFSSRSIFSLDISAATVDPPIRTVGLSIPIDDYFVASAVAAVSKGRLVTTMGNHNNASIIALTRSLRERAKSRGWLYTNTEERIYTLISYRDLLNREHEEYYLVEPVVGASRISNEEGQAKFTAWRMNKLRQRISDLSADIVFGELSTTLARRH